MPSQVSKPPETEAFSPIKDRVGSPTPIRNLSLPLLLLAIGVIIVTSLAINFNFTQEHEREAARLEAIADLKTGQLEIWFRERTRDVRYVGDSPYLQGLAASWRQRGDKNARERLLERIEQTREIYDYEGTYFFDGVEPLLQSRQKQTAIEPKLQAAILEALSSGEFRYLGPYPDQSGRIVLDFIGPLGIGKRQTGAAVVLRVDPSKVLFPLLNAWPYPSPSGENVLVRRDGDEIVFLNDLRFKPGEATRLHIPVTNKLLLSAQLFRHKAELGRFIEGVDYRQIPAVGVIRAIQGTDWFLISKMDAAEANRTAYRNAIWLAAIGFMALLLIGSAVIALHQRQTIFDNLVARTTQEERIRSLELLDAIASSSNDAIFAKDVQGHYLMCNAEMAHTLGADPKKIIGHDDFTLLPHDIADKWTENDRSVIESNQIQTFVEELVSDEGKTIFESTKGPLHDRLDNTIGLFGISRNITAQEKTKHD